MFFFNSLIIPEVTIGEGAIALLGSVVTRNVESYTVVGGNSEKKVRQRVTEINCKIDYNYFFAL